jgi:hypothetical protein
VNITYAVEPNLQLQEFVDVLERSTLAEWRPVTDVSTITGMLTHADGIVTARTGDHHSCWRIPRQLRDES